MTDSPNNQAKNFSVAPVINIPTPGGQNNAVVTPVPTTTPTSTTAAASMPNTASTAANSPNDPVSTQMHAGILSGV
jgi:hypothetical protein